MTIIPVKIKEIRDATPTIKVLTIDLHGQPFTYHAGQWIDCYADINKKREIVGYSLASSPSKDSTIELAVKISDNLVSKYIHEHGKIGDILYIEGGQGDIFYQKKQGTQVVLIGAGIGIAPLMGILRYIHESTTAMVTMIQSATTFEELLYFDELRETSGRNPRINYIPSLTRETVKEINHGRITGDLIKNLKIDPDSLFYLSGPGGMIPELEEALIEMGASEERIKYEVWWKPSH